MAKLSFNKLKLKTPEDTQIIFNEQEITIKKYLPINDKLKLITNVINLTADENKFLNIGKLDLFFNLEVIKNYTNIIFTEKQLEDPCKQFDLIHSSNLFVEVVKAIGEEEIDYLYSILRETVNEIYKYNNSVLGLLETITQDYSNLNLEASEIQKKLADPNNLTLLKDVMAKLG